MPLDDRRVERLIPEKAGRPTLIHGNTQLLFGGMGRLSESSVINTKNKSFSITSGIEAPDVGAKGVIVAQGASIGGWSLYAHEGKLKYCYNVCGVQHFFTEATSAIPSGTHQARIEYAHDGGELGKGGDVSLYIDGNQVGEGRVELTQPMIFSADETCDVCIDNASSVSPDYNPKSSAFNGTVNWVQIEVGKEDHDHLISPDERFTVAMARQ